MRTTTPKTDLTKNDVHQSTQHTYSAESSELGWPIGEWPRVVTLEGVHLTLAKLDKDRDGDVRFAVYSSRLPAGITTLTVFND